MIYWTKNQKKAFQYMIAPCIIVVLLLTWEFLVHIRDIPNWLLPAPSDITVTLFQDAWMLSGHTWVTFIEVVLGFGVAVVAGVFLASVITLSRSVEQSIYPIIIASQTIPIIVIAPMLLVWIGYGLTPKIIVVALISFFPVTVNMVDGLRAIDPDMQRVLRTMGANKWQEFIKVRFPTSLPYLFSGLKVAIAVSVIGAVIGEWVGSKEGLGYLMIRSKPQFQTERVFAAIVILSFMGVLLFILIGLLQRLLTPWHRREVESKKLDD